MPAVNVYIYFIYTYIYIYIYIEKGFDTVDYQILLQKLYHYGIRGLAHNWFRWFYLIDNNSFLYQVLL